jgi:hypothetical protein
LNARVSVAETESSKRDKRRRAAVEAPERPSSMGKIALGMAMCALLGILAPSLMGRELLAYRDMLQNYWPMKASFWERSGGVLPLWNGDYFGGLSYISDVIQQPLYPPNLLFRMFGVPAPTGISWYLALHALLGLTGTYLLARRWVSPCGAAFAAASFVLSGFMMGHLGGAVHFYCAYSLAPWVLLAYLRLAQKHTMARWAQAVLATPLPLFAGDPQAFCELALLGGLIFLIASGPRWKQSLGTGIALILAAAVLASPQITAMLQALPDLLRVKELNETGRLVWSLHPARLPELYVPRLFGPLFKEGFWGGFTVSSPWHRNYVHSLYMGMLLPALTYAALRSRPRIALALLATFLFFTWVALGRYSFGYRIFVEIVPGWQLYRYPQRVMLLPTLAIALLAGTGAGALWIRCKREQAILLGASLVIGVTTLLLFVLFSPEKPWDQVASRTAVQASLFQLVGVGCAALLWTRVSTWRISPLLLMVIHLSDLLIANGTLIGQLDRAPFLARPRICSVLDAHSRSSASPGGGDLWRVHVDEAAMKSATGLAVPEAVQEVLPRWGQTRWREYQWGKRNLLNLCGLHYSVGLSSFTPLLFRTLWKNAGPFRALRASSTRFVVSSSGSFFTSEPDARKVFEDPKLGMTIVEFKGALPRLYRPDEVTVLSRKDFLAFLRRDSRSLTKAITALEPGPALHEHRRSAVSRITMFHDDGDSLSFTIDQDQPGYWVLTDSFDVHWTAWVDNVPAVIKRADLRHRAVWLPAGIHEVRMVYRPWALLVLAGAALLFAVVLGVVALRREKKGGPRGKFGTP